jgi:hypothetical protein
MSFRGRTRPSVVVRSVSVRASHLPFWPKTDAKITDAKRVEPVVPTFLVISLESFMWASQNCLHFISGHAFLNLVIGIAPERVIAIHYADDLRRKKTTT